MCNKLTALLVGLLACAEIASAKPKDSALSEYKGSYSGKIQVVSFGAPIVSTTRGTISSSKKKEKGTISLQSVINTGTPMSWNEKYAISNRSLTYTISAGPSFATGKGRVNVKSRKITYSATFFLNSVGTYFVRGTMTRSGKGGRKLKITETLTGPATIFVTYNLTKRGKG